MQLQHLNEQELYNLLTLRLEQHKQDLTTEQRLSVTLDIHNIRYQLWLHGNDLINKEIKVSKFSDKNWFSIGTNKMKNNSVSKIQNVSQQAVIDGDCFDPTASNLHLIQITDYDSEFVEPKNWRHYKSIRQYKFNDTEDLFDSNCITDLQAKHIAEALKHVLMLGDDLVVHCHAGICRSGAVVECAEAIGFQKCNNFRLPNALVKRKIMQALGVAVTAETSCFNQD